MPLKRGPKGSSRLYSSSTGRYIKMNLEDKLALFCGSQKKKISKKEREDILTQQLREKAAKSKDDLLLNVFDYIEEKIPHYYRFVNEKMFISEEHKVREIDLVGKNAIIEIKSGSKSKYLRQLLAQKSEADKRNKKYILFAPKVPDVSKYLFEQKGIIVAKTLDDLYEVIKT